MKSVHYVTLGVALSAGFSASAQVSTTQFAPQYRRIPSFGLRGVSQILTSKDKVTGSAWCQSLRPNLQCFAVSGGHRCSANVPVGEIVSCDPDGTPAFDARGFGPIDCQGQPIGPIGPLGPQDWCLIANLQPSREMDTLYLMSNYLRIGINKRFGGTIFELYGTDRKNRLMQNGGGAMQLSLWGDDATYAPAGSVISYFQTPISNLACNPTAYGTLNSCEVSTGGMCQAGLVGPNLSNCQSQLACGDNGAAAGAPINPIQAISANCSYGQTSVSNDEAAVDTIFAPKRDAFAVRKKGPEQFTKSSNNLLKKLKWTETVRLAGPFAQVTYSLTYHGTTKWNPDFQEIPAIFTSQGMTGALLYYYSGDRPYRDAASSVTRASAALGDNTPQIYQLPNRSGPFGTGVPNGHGALLTEDWVSLCNASGRSCITVMSWSKDAQDVVYGPGDYAYFGIHGFFPITTELNKTIPVWIAPYRFDDVVDGLTLREWAYKLRPR